MRPFLVALVAISLLLIPIPPASAQESFNCLSAFGLAGRERDAYQKTTLNKSVFEYQTSDKCDVLIYRPGQDYHYASLAIHMFINQASAEAKYTELKPVYSQSSTSQYTYQTSQGDRTVYPSVISNQENSGYGYEVEYFDPYDDSEAPYYRTPNLGVRYSGRVGNCAFKVENTGVPDKGGNFHPTREAAVSDAESLINEIKSIGESIQNNLALYGFCKVELAPPLLPEEKKENETCKIKDPDTLFQPMQGVWQDDYIFADVNGKRIRKTAPATYYAEIPMVKGRDSLIFGLRGDINPETDQQRRKIVFKATTTGTVDVLVKVKITLVQGGGKKTIYESPAATAMPLDGPCGVERPFEFGFSAPAGLPDPGTFKFDRKGPYEIVAELVRADNNNPSGLSGKVLGEVVETFSPETHFLPVTIRQLSIGLNATRLIRWSNKLASLAYDFIPDYYPLQPASFHAVRYNSTRDMNDTINNASTDFFNYVQAVVWSGNYVEPKILPRIFEGMKQEAMIAALSDEIGTAGQLGGAGRIIVPLWPTDYDMIQSIPSTAFAASKKVIFISYDPLGSNGSVSKTIAHELAHTMDYIWSSDKMESQCGIDYHNKDELMAHGFRIVYKGNEALPRGGTSAGVRTLMGPRRADVYNETNYTYWISQCTYWNLVNQLQKKPDPDLILVRGILARNTTQLFGSLLPFYAFQGEPELDESSSGQTFIILKSSSGSKLAKYSFDPMWEIPDIDKDRNLISFSYRVPNIPGTVEIDLVGPEGVLATKKLSLNPPSVKITKPVNIGYESAEVKWVGSDPDGDDILYTVLYSSDGGKTWATQLFEKPATELSVQLDSTSFQHKIKVIATDGSRSSEDVVEFSTQKPTNTATQNPERPADIVPVAVISAIIISLAVIWFTKFRL